MDKFFKNWQLHDCLVYLHIYINIYFSTLSANFSIDISYCLQLHFLSIYTQITYQRRIFVKFRQKHWFYEPSQLLYLMPCRGHVLIRDFRRYWAIIILTLRFIKIMIVAVLYHFWFTLQNYCKIIRFSKIEK